MPFSAEPLRLIVLAAPGHWQAALRESLDALGLSAALVTAPSWPAACNLLDDGSECLLLCTPEQQPQDCPLPLILLLEQPPADGAADADDWLLFEQLDHDSLARCLRHVRQRAVLQRRLQQLGGQDPLTGIANRQVFHRLLAGRLADPGRDGCTLGYLDLDNFKHINDSLGQLAGDRLIIQVVSRLQALLEPGDQLARLGSDEFALLLGGAHCDQAQQTAERMMVALAEPFWLEGESLLLGCSLGLARARAGGDADTLLWHARQAMQQAKREPGCALSCYDACTHCGVTSRAEQEAELRRALRRDELELHYQPRLCLESGAVVGVEALARWRHPQRGLLGPEHFVPLAEESGLIVPLGYWVIARALRDMQWLLGRGLPPLHMAINLSFNQFRDSQLLVTLQRLIRERGVDARWLEFELTETAVMQRSEEVSAVMRALGELGVRFALDDFGTGYSSFVHLSSLPVALLKIDRSFVAGMVEHPERRQLVQAMIGLAGNLRLDVVAEGVETVEQLELLRAAGCRQVQGYLVSKPLPLVELVRLLVFGRQRLAVAASAGM